MGDAAFLMGEPDLAARDWRQLARCPFRGAFARRRLAAVEAGKGLDDPALAGPAPGAGGGRVAAVAGGSCFGVIGGSLDGSVGGDVGNRHNNLRKSVKGDIRGTVGGSVYGKVMGSVYGRVEGDVHEIYGDIKEGAYIGGRVDILHGRNHGTVMGGIVKMR